MPLKTGTPGTIAIKPRSNGCILYAEGLGRHLTLIVDGSRLTIHESDESTPSGLSERHVHLLTLDVDLLVRKLDSPSFQRSIERRLVRLFCPVRSPQQLYEEGAVALVTLPPPVEVEPDPPSAIELDTSAVELKPLSEPWHASPGTCFMAVRADATPLGMIFVGRPGQRIRIRIMRYADCLDSIKWLLCAIARPQPELLRVLG